ncbi:FAD binding domain-containing protein [Pusillimonas noertemannii]|uniref:FAD binding domain-containing protein n=1 Tax=Pusillimonas noertemannii TaxID=305977 RepID=UPI0002EC91D8|nr:FAD binding domain-containing protein [Pusillimonas noertemannii]
MDQAAQAKKGKAIIIGGSMGGLFAGNLLLRAGWQAEIHERVHGPLSDRGAGIVTHQELLHALKLAGAAVDETLGVSIPSRVTFDRQGRSIAELPYEQLLTAWSRLLGVLEDAFPARHYHRGKALARIEQEADSVTAIFEDGTHATGDLLVGADGIRSATRAQAMPGSEPVYAGYVAWRGLVEESELSPQAHQALMERFAFYLPPNEQMLTYPVAGRADAISKGARRINFVWYRPADEETELRRLQTDASGRHHAGGIPPTAIHPEVLDEVRKAATDTLPPVFAEVVHKTPLLFFQPIFDLECERMAAGRVALLGDAAFVARPHSGMGVTKAAYDALELTEALGSEAGIHQALARYQAERGRFGRSIVGHARNMGACMLADPSSAHEREMARRYRDPGPLMRETAVSLRYLKLDP